MLGFDQKIKQKSPIPMLIVAYIYYSESIRYFYYYLHCSINFPSILPIVIFPYFIHFQSLIMDFLFIVVIINFILVLLLFSFLSWFNLSTAFCVN